MKRSLKLFLLACICLFSVGCSSQKNDLVKPVFSTKSVADDADDCAIWIHPSDRQQSTIIGNDKGKDGALYVWDLSGKLVYKTPKLVQPQNVDLAYSVMLSGKKTDIVACPLRQSNQIKAFKIDPTTRTLIDITARGGIPTGLESSPYGFALYHQKSTGKLYAFVSSHEKEENVSQLLLEEDASGRLKGSVVRSFGKPHIKSVVEGMVVDEELGFVYLADENQGILKFYADPKKDALLLNAFALDDQIKGDREGIALYACDGGKGYIILSSQGNSALKVYERDGDNAFVTTIFKEGSTETDGIAASSCPIPPKFPYGLLVCHNDKKKNFAIYSWEDIARDRLLKCFCKSRG